MPPEEETGLGNVEHRLYTPNADTSYNRDRLRAANPHAVPHAWDEPMPIVKKQKTPFAVLFFMGAVVFFLLAGAIAAFLLLSGERSVSTDNIGVTVQGPTTIAAGDTVPLSITIDNRNPTELDSPDFTVSFPQGTRSATDVTQSYPRYEENLPTIPSGGSINRSVKAVLFGEQGQTITIPIEITYKTPGSNAVFKKDTTYQLTVSTSPISLTVTTLSQTVSGQPLTIDVSVRSNATKPIPGIVISSVYPFGFTPTNQTIQPNSAGLFSLDTLNPGQTKDLKITGVLTGQTSDTDSFQFTAGTAGTDGSLAVPYTTQQASIALEAPFLNVGIAVNGSTANNTVIAPGQPVSATVSWQNTLASEIDNGEIVIALKGAGIDPSSVQVTNGFYQSSDNTIHFDKSTDQAIASLAPGATGQGSFSFSTLPNAASSGGTITMQVSITGQRLNESSVPESVNASLTKTLRLQNSLALATGSLHKSGSFTNPGPIPPVSNQTTGYTAVWKLSSNVNAVATANVTATLPPYVNWTGQSVASVGTISYDPSSRTVTWNIGDLQANSPASQASFQVSFTPSVSQKGTAPTLVSPATFTGYDSFAQSQLSVQGDAITTDDRQDAGYRPGDGDVQ